MIDANYFGLSALMHMYKGVNENGELIPRIKVFMARGGSLLSEQGDILISKAKKFDLKMAVDFIERNRKLQVISLVTSVTLPIIFATSLCY